jgi:hypothetical protein
MKFNTITKHTGVLVAGASAVIAAGTLTAYSAAATPAAAMPSAATFIADMPHSSDSDMTTMAVTVEGANVVAYVTDGTDEDAYFVGTQKDGRMDLMSMYADHLVATFDGTTLSGQLTMNENGAAPQAFAADPVQSPAGMYTATDGTARVSYIVRPDHTMVGVMDNSAPGDHKVTDAIAAKDQQFKDRVRQMRLDRQMQEAPSMKFGTWSMNLHGTTVTATPVTGSMTI